MNFSCALVLRLYQHMEKCGNHWLWTILHMVSKVIQKIRYRLQTSVFGLVFTHFERNIDYRSSTRLCAIPLSAFRFLDSAFIIYTCISAHELNDWLIRETDCARETILLLSTIYCLSRLFYYWVLYILYALDDNVFDARKDHRKVRSRIGEPTFHRVLLAMRTLTITRCVAQDYRS